MTNRLASHASNHAQLNTCLVAGHSDCVMCVSSAYCTALQVIVQPVGVGKFASQVAGASATAVMLPATKPGESIKKLSFEYTSYMGCMQTNPLSNRWKDIEVLFVQQCSHAMRQWTQW